MKKLYNAKSANGIKKRRGCKKPDAVSIKRNRHKALEMTEEKKRNRGMFGELSVFVKKAVKAKKKKSKRRKKG